MSSAIENVFIIIELLEFITGIWGNGFIILVICADWVKTKKISLLDFIFTSLAISRIGMICILFEDSLKTVFYSGIFENHLMMIVVSDFFWDLNNNISTWCATSLSVFYFLKLSNFSHPFFLWLKWRRDRVVITILLGFFLSLFVGLLNIKFDAFKVSEYLKTERNWTRKEYMRKTQYFNNKILLNLGSLIPMVVSLISFFLLILSLWRHIRQMMHYAKGSGDFNTEVYVKARNTMISFIIFLVVHYFFTILLLWSYSTIENSLSMIICETVVLLYPSIHPIHMILGNRKLRRTAVNLLRQMSPASRERDSSQHAGTENY